MIRPYDLAGLEKTRTDRDRHFRSHYASPIPEEQRSGFRGLAYFPGRANWLCRGSFTPTEGRIDIRSSTGGTRSYHVAGTVHLRIGDREADLIVLHGEDGDLFAPFTDGTSGTESYGGGRYVPVVVDGSDATVDFNLAMNPWCAYDEEFSCPLPPPQNRLPMRVDAGERDYRSR